MHPDDVPGEYPGEHEHVDGTEHKTAETDPHKAGKGLKNSMMKLYSGLCSPRKESSNKTEYVDYLHAQHTFPPIRF